VTAPVAPAARPKNRFAYGERSLARLAAQYAFGLARNHPFVDGNKCTSLIVLELFIALNGSELTASDSEFARVFLELAADDISEEELANWVEANTRLQGGACQARLEPA
jgi:death-on-curing protein